MPSYFSLKSISGPFRQELETNQEDSCKKNLPKPNHEKQPYEYILWSILGGPFS